MHVIKFSDCFSLYLSLKKVVGRSSRRSFRKNRNFIIFIIKVNLKNLIFVNILFLVLSLKRLTNVNLFNISTQLAAKFFLARIISRLASS